MPTEPEAALAVVDWRRRVDDLYASVRAAASPEQGHAAWVAGRASLFSWHPASPRQDGQELRHAAYDGRLRFVLPLLPTTAETWVASTGSDGEAPFTRIGRFEVPEVGSLDVWWLETYGGGVFVPLRDASAGRSTYGAGRYLLDTVKGADLGRVGEDWVVDLNFAYHPSCAYDAAWACPLAPPGNRVDVAVDAGELMPSPVAG